MASASKTTPRWLTSDEQRVWRSYLSANRLVFDQIDRELQRDSGLPHAYYEILVRLSEAPDRALRMSALADRSQSSRSRLSHAVARLEDSGFVTRESCPSDKRGQIARLTDDGFAALHAAAQLHVESVRAHVFDPLTPAQLEQLRTISQALLDALAEGADTGGGGG